MFTLPDPDDDDSPWPIFRRLLETHAELAELSELLDSDVKLAIVMRGGEEWREGGREILGRCELPQVQGRLKGLFEWLLEEKLGYLPGFLITLNAGWWEAATPDLREILVFHEALHACQAKDRYGAARFNRQTGEPILGIRPHDVEEFTAVVARYGAWKADLAEFLAAAAKD